MDGCNPTIYFPTDLHTIFSTFLHSVDFVTCPPTLGIVGKDQKAWSVNSQHSLNSSFLSGNRRPSL